MGRTKGAGAGGASKRHGGDGKRKKARKTARPSSGKKKSSGVVKKQKKKLPNAVADPPPKVVVAALAAPELNKGQRKESRDEVATKAKVLWEKLRIREGSSSEKQEGLVAQLQKMLQGRLAEMAVRHDTSRIIQWMLACGSSEQQTALKKELMPSFVVMAMDKYARHLMMKLIRLAKRNERVEIFEAMQGHVMSMVRSAHGADVLDFAYQTVATAQQKTELTTEFLHGKETALLSSLRMKRAKVKTFNDMLTQAGETFRPALLSSAGEIIKALSGKEASLRMALVHRACREYTSVLDEGSDEMDEIAQLFGPSALSFVHTKDGVIFICKVLSALKTQASFLEVLEEIKGNALKVASDEYGHMFIMCLLGRVDDQELLWNHILAEIVNVGQDEMKDILCHKHARMVFLHLLAPGSTRHFHPEAYAFLGEAREIIARAALLDRLQPSLSSAVEKSMKSLLVDSIGAAVAIEYILYTKSSEVMESVVTVLREALSCGEEETALSNPVGLRTLRWLVSLTAANELSLSDMVIMRDGLVEALGSSNGGCKILLVMLKNEKVRQEILCKLCQATSPVVDSELRALIVEAKKTTIESGDSTKKQRRE